MSEQTPTLVAVTGASGFIGAWIVRRLLEGGYRVRATVRDPDKASSVAHLRELAVAADRLELVRGQLLEPGSFDDAVGGCRFVVHTASPYVLTVEDPQRDLVDPAVQGTRNVLESCKRAGTVERVVVTSSMAAITDEPDSDHLLTEADWNEKSSLERNPYYYSKTLAEKEAWRFVEAERPGFDLVAVNPFMVIGPSLSPGLNTSNQLLADLLTGQYPGIMRITWGFVDVRDVAEAHVAALEHREAAGRYLCANTTMNMRELVELLRDAGYGEGRKLPKLGLDCAAGDYAVRLASYLQPRGVGTYLRTHVGRVPSFDNSKLLRELGLELHPLEQTIRDTVDDLIRWGHLEEAKTD
jgi:dihydroflavonol-4-reductase